MGEKIKILSTGKILSTCFEVELNHPSCADGDAQIHIQSEKGRFDMDKSDYLKYAFSVLLAEKNLKNMKKIK